MSKIDDGWKKLFEKYNIAETIHKNGLFIITADQIREVREPRLMTKFDTKESLPSVFEKGKIGILPVTRGSYVLGYFNLFEDFPESVPEAKKIIKAGVPEFLETINIHNITSESNAINVMHVSGILQHFLGEEDIFSTVSGRMGSGEFCFSVDGKTRLHALKVENSQLEIDGGFESPNSFAIIEAKNVVHDDFLIRQLYYPVRLWCNRIQKPIRPVFMVYSNGLFRLLEYEFTDLQMYNSINLVRESYYTLEDYSITLKDIHDVWKSTLTEVEPDVPFIQANSFEKVISLLEHIVQKPMTTVEIAELFAFKERQSDYYFNACKYLGLAEKKPFIDENGKSIMKVWSSDLGRKIMLMSYKKRQLALCGQIFKHRLFHELFETILSAGEIPDYQYITSKMFQLHVCGEDLISRRSSSVRSWLLWILNLISEDN